MIDRLPRWVITDSSDPLDSNENALRDEPTLKAEANDPMLPMDKKDPTLPIDSVDPTEPMDRNESREAMDQRLRGLICPL